MKADKIVLIIVGFVTFALILYNVFIRASPTLMAFMVVAGIMFLLVALEVVSHSFFPDSRISRFFEKLRECIQDLYI